MILDLIKKPRKQNYFKSRSSNLLKTFQFRVLVIEDDYVSFLLLNEMLSSLDISVIRLNTLEEALQEKGLCQSVNLIIINISLTCTARIGAIECLRNIYDVPVIVADGNEQKGFRYEEMVEWADGVLSLSDDKDYFSETISDMLINNQL